MSKTGDITKITTHIDEYSPRHIGSTLSTTRISCTTPLHEQTYRLVFKASATVCTPKEVRCAGTAFNRVSTINSASTQCNLKACAQASRPFFFSFSICSLLAKPHDMSERMTHGAIWGQGASCWKEAALAMDEHFLASPDHGIVSFVLLIILAAHASFYTCLD